MKEKLFLYLLQLGDNSLILGHRLSEWCGHGPILEVDMALTNIALDLMGQTRNYFQYAAEIEGKDRTEDDLAFLRSDREYRNILLVEQPNEDFAYTMARQFFFDAFHLLFLKELQGSNDEQMAAIASKSIKEVAYHHRFSSDWVIRLGDGTEQSQAKMQAGIDEFWNFTEEFFTMNEVEKEMLEMGIGVDLPKLKEPFLTRVKEVLETAQLSLPEHTPMQQGGKDGLHSEHLGHLLSEMQYMQRAYPGMEW